MHNINPINNLYKAKWGRPASKIGGKNAYLEEHRDYRPCEFSIIVTYMDVDTSMQIRDMENLILPDGEM
jgi:hypothetical protein